VTKDVKTKAGGIRVMAIDAVVELKNWDSVSKLDNWETLLLGNGFSTNIWGGFGYDELLRKADLSDDVNELFKTLATSDFEAVLSQVQSAIPIAEALGVESDSMRSAYIEIRRKLLDAIQRTHIQHSQINASAFKEMQQYFWPLRKVFVTNYDLLTYWIQMYEHDEFGDRSKDFMWRSPPTFDITDVEPADKTMLLIYYLHGGLHLWRNDWSGLEGKARLKGETVKQIFADYELSNSKRPLFISEGSSASKLKAIDKSAYLSFCLDSLRKDCGNTVVFGHSLADQDDHIVRALKTGDREGERRIAISIFPNQDKSTIQGIIHEIKGKLAGLDLVFFDSTTHPLGKRAFQVSP
jgi:hypothetical protein